MQQSLLSSGSNCVYVLPAFDIDVMSQHRHLYFLRIIYAQCSYVLRRYVMKMMKIKIRQKSIIITYLIKGFYLHRRPKPLYRMIQYKTAANNAAFEFLWHFIASFSRRAHALATLDTALDDKKETAGDWLLGGDTNGKV